MPTALSRRLRVELPIAIGLIAVIFFFGASGFISYINTSILRQDAQLVTHTHEVIISVDDLIALLNDAETGQRGYILTGDEKYLEPYHKSLTLLDEELNDVQRLTADNPVQQARIPAVKSHIAAKLAELDESITLRRSKGFDAARALVVSDRGKNEMDALRSQIDQMRLEEQNLRKKRLIEMEDAYHIAIISGILAGVLGITLSGAVA